MYSLVAFVFFAVFSYGRVDDDGVNVENSYVREDAFGLF